LLHFLWIPILPIGPGRRDEHNDMSVGIYWELMHKED
jgi:hypothetical protein